MAAEAEAQEPKKKLPIVKILVMTVGAIVLIGVGAGAAILFNKLTKPADENPLAIVIERKGGALTGLFQERAMRLIRDVIPPPDEAAMVAAIERAGNHLASLGFASATTRRTPRAVSSSARAAR